MGGVGVFGLADHFLSEDPILFKGVFEIRNAAFSRVHLRDRGQNGCLSIGEKFFVLGLAYFLLVDLDDCVDRLGTNLAQVEVRVLDDTVVLIFGGRGDASLGDLRLDGVLQLADVLADYAVIVGGDDLGAHDIGFEYEFEVVTGDFFVLAQVQEVFFGGRFRGCRSDEVRGLVLLRADIVRIDFFYEIAALESSLTTEGLGAQVGAGNGP